MSSAHRDRVPTAGGFPLLLAPVDLGPIRVANRLFFPAMGLDLAHEDGCFSDALREFYTGMIDGGCGALILSNASVAPDTALLPRALRMYSDQHAESLRTFLADAKSRGVLVGIQLQHYGAQGMTLHSSAREVMTPSGIASESQRRKDPAYRVRIMDRDDIRAVTDQFARSAALARRAGAELIQIQASNGYLLGSFFSPATNRRCDRYGGSVDARARFLLEVVRAVRQAVGDGVALGVRIGIDDLLGDRGTQVEDWRDVVPALEHAGVDLFEASFAVAETFRALFQDGSGQIRDYLQEQVSKVRAYCSVPVGFAGMTASIAEAEQLLARGVADWIGMARALFADNDLLAKTLAGREDDIHRCLWDGRCFQDKYDPRYSRVHCCVNPRYLRPA